MRQALTFSKRRRATATASSENAMLLPNQKTPMHHRPVPEVKKQQNSSHKKQSIPHHATVGRGWVRRLVRPSTPRDPFWVGCVHSALHHGGEAIAPCPALFHLHSLEYCTATAALHRS
ncbi:hypothetical protein TcCL_NonESM10929, partial [Trypanosoma cruzi]